MMTNKYTMLQFMRGGVVKYARLVKNYKLVDEQLAKDSFNVNAVVKYANEHKIKYNTITINQ